MKLTRGKNLNNVLSQGEGTAIEDRQDANIPEGQGAASPGGVRQASANRRVDELLGATTDGGMNLAKVDSRQVLSDWQAGNVQTREAILRALDRVVKQSETNPDEVARIMEVAPEILEDAARQGVRMTDIIRRVVFKEDDLRQGIRVGAADLASEMARRNVEVIPAVDALKRLSADPSSEVRSHTIGGLLDALDWAENENEDPLSHPDVAEIVKTEAEVALQRLEFDRVPSVVAVYRDLTEAREV